MGILVILAEKGTLSALVFEQVAPCHSRCSRGPMDRKGYFWIFWGPARKSRADKIRYQQSTYYVKVKFPTAHGIGEIRRDKVLARECYQVALASRENHTWMIEKPEPIPESSEVPQEIEIVPRGPSKVLKIGSTLSTSEKMRITNFPRENQDVFAWKHKDMPRIDRGVIQHHLNVDPECRPV